MPESLVEWSALSNPVLEYEDRSIKDFACAHRGGAFFLFFSAFSEDRGRVRSHVVGVRTEDFRSYRDRVGRLMWLGREAIELGQRDGTIRNDVDPLDLVMQLWGGMLGVLMLNVAGDGFRRRTPLPIDPEAALPLYIENMMRAIAIPNSTETA